MSVSPNTSILTKSRSWEMFDDIATRYDFLNRMLSFGLDIHWRKHLAYLLPSKEKLFVLDLATGTADVLLTLFKYNPQVRSGCGIDLAENMLEIGRTKVIRAGLMANIMLNNGDINHIPVDDETFDATTIAFGIRNVDDPSRVLSEMRRVLKSGGRALVLEFSQPPHPVIRQLYLWYLRFGVPLIGALFSGHYHAYRYLNRTIESFPYGKDFCKMMTKAGFVNVAAKPLFLGTATIYVGDKQP